MLNTTRVNSYALLLAFAAFGGCFLGDGAQNAAAAGATGLRFKITDRSGVTTTIEQARAEYLSSGFGSTTWTEEPGLIAYVGEGTVVIAWDKIKRLTATRNHGPSINSYEQTVELADGKTTVLSFEQVRISGESDLGEYRVFISDIKELRNLTNQQKQVVVYTGKLADGVKASIRDDMAEQWKHSERYLSRENWRKIINQYHLATELLELSDGQNPDWILIPCHFKDKTEAAVSIEYFVKKYGDGQIIRDGGLVLYFYGSIAVGHPENETTLTHILIQRRMIKFLSQQLFPPRFPRWPVK